MSIEPINVLFLCTHNSARSILAEALLNHISKGRFKAYSAGSSPRENQQPNPIGIEVLKAAGIATDSLRSKSWDDFAKPDAPKMNLVITCATTPLVRPVPTGPASLPLRIGATQTPLLVTQTTPTSAKLSGTHCTRCAADLTCWSTCQRPASAA